MIKNEGSVSEVEVMNVHDLAKYLRMSEAKAYKLARQGSLPALRLGKSWRFRKDLIDDWMRRETEESLQSMK